MATENKAVVENNIMHKRNWRIKEAAKIWTRVVPGDIQIALNMEKEIDITWILGRDGVLWHILNVLIGFNSVVSVDGFIFRLRGFASDGSLLRGGLWKNLPDFRT